MADSSGGVDGLARSSARTWSLTRSSNTASEAGRPVPEPLAEPLADDGVVVPALEDVTVSGGVADRRLRPRPLRATLARVAARDDLRDCFGIAKKEERS